MATQSTYSGLADAGMALVELLYTGLDEHPHVTIKRDAIALGSPETAGSEARLTVFLYRVTENSHLPDADRRTAVGDGNDVDSVDDPPLVLDLHYLLTAHPKQSGQSTTGRSTTAVTGEQHELLGIAMEVLHENPILRGTELSESFSGRELRISLESPSTSELTTLWSTFDDQPFRPSVAYSVTPVHVGSAESQDVRRVVTRRIEEYSGP